VRHVHSLYLVERQKGLWTWQDFLQKIFVPTNHKIKLLNWLTSYIQVEDTAGGCPESIGWNHSSMKTFRKAHLVVWFFFLNLEYP
jgi:hypothetical protein